MIRRQRYELDVDAFARLYRLHASGFVAFFAKRLRVREDALDLTAETFARAFASRRRFRGSDEQQALAWLYGIARNLLLQHIRSSQIDLRALAKLGIEPRVLEDDEIERLVASDVDTELLQAVAQALSTLPPGQQRALVGRIIGELSYEELASKLGVTPQAARARVARGMRTLRAHIGDTS